MKMPLGQRWMVGALCSVAMHAALSATFNSYDGPAFSATVTRGEVTLPMLQVDRLQKGDHLVITPSEELASRKDWLMVLASISRSGTEITVKPYPIQEGQRFELDIPADDAVPAIVIAPALRTLFGITTSIGQSADLIEQAIRSDPQRFVELQKIDQINQAARALADVLSAVPASKGVEGLNEAARSAATRYGLPVVSVDCVKNNGVDIQCLATEIVRRANVEAMSADKLGSLNGKPDEGKLPGQLDEGIKTFTAAADYFTSRYRDLYDFTPTFARSGQGAEGVKLYAIDRYRNGGIKTAYVYVPAWFQGRTPALTVESKQPVCLTAGRLPLIATGRLPLSNYWYDWRLDLLDGSKSKAVQSVPILDMHPEFGEVNVRVDAAQLPQAGNVVTGRLSGMLGFQRLTLPDAAFALPVMKDLDDALQGEASLISGEMGHLRVASSSAYCVQQLKLQVNGQTIAASTASAPNRLDVDLSHVPAQKAALTVSQAGVPDQVFPLDIMAPRTRIKSLVHQDGDDDVAVEGERLDRIAQVRLGSVTCAPKGVPTAGATAAINGKLVLGCDAASSNAALPDRAVVTHVGGKPAALTVALTKGEARPRFALAATPTALLVQPSDKALQWGVARTAGVSTDDSGIAVLLQAQEGYTVRNGAYALQLRISEDVANDNAVFTVPLMVNKARGELRTRVPFVYPGALLPTVVNHLQYRVVHTPSGLAGDWKDAPHAILMLPNFTATNCGPEAGQWQLLGDRLDLIEGVGHLLPGESSAARWQAVPLSRCGEGACLVLSGKAAPQQIAVKVAWIDQPFTVTLPPASACGAAR